MKALAATLLLLAGHLAAACSAPQAEPTAAGGSCSLALPADAGADAHLAALLAAESDLVVTQQIEALMALWAADAEVVDAKHTPADVADDQRWMGLDAVRHRYVRIVFPGAPAALPADAQRPELVISLEGERATVRAATRIGDEIAPGGDQWTFVHADGCWSIESLTYNLEATP